MAQGLDLKTWDSDKSPSTDCNKVNETVKRTRVMGSRRIFPPQFKLQVLDSYRNDLDCRGNQRATARKYNIHRRQIQKWLQCEQNLRTSVEEGVKNETDFVFRGKKSDGNGIVKNGDGKMDSALNRSAMIYTRLNDAERTREENAVRPTLKQETKVYDVQDLSSVKLEAQNLKRVAQKLYPSSHSITFEVGENIMHRTVHISGQKFHPNEILDDNFNKILPEGRDVEDGPLDLINKARSGQREEVVPKECFLNDTPNEIFTVQIEKNETDLVNDKLNMDDAVVERQKLCESNAVPKCLVQKYTNDSEGLKFNTNDGARDELLCSRSVDAESSCLLDKQVPVTSTVPNVSLDNVPSDFRAKLKTKLNDDIKSFSPKRKWIQESLQEQSEPLTENARSRSYPVLPIKQRVKMNLRSTPGSPVVEDDSSSRKGVSPNFTIERLCSSDFKTENVTPVSFHSPVESDCYNWSSNPCSFSIPPVSQMPFPPPLFLPHRVIPDLVSLHFKPEVFEQKNQQFNSYESVDIPMKEEKLSDNEENMDIDVLNTTPVEKKTFDFSNYNMGKRRSFSVQFKLTVLDAFHNDKDCNKNQRATARKFNINRRQVQKWLSQENDLRSEGSIKNGKYLQRQRLGTDRDTDSNESCMQCPQHCIRKKREDIAKSIEVNVKHCSDNQCLSRDKSSPDNPKESYDYYGKNCFQSDLKSANIYDNYLIPENNNMIYHDSIINWPNINASALPVPNFPYMPSWYNFDYCHEKSKIY